MKRLIMVLLLAAQASFAAPDTSRAAAVEQWRSYRFGLFIHWGVASGRTLPHSRSHARQNMLNPSGSVPAKVYAHCYKESNPTQYDPGAWLKLGHDAGMPYAVFVAKHHAGFSMYRSTVSPYNIIATLYVKDVAAMFAETCRRWL